MQNKAFYKFLLYIGMLCFFSACSNSNNLSDLEAYVTQIKQKQQAAAEQEITSQLKEPLAAAYSAKSFRIPFGETAALLENKDTSANPLQAVPLNMLRFTGTLVEGNTTLGFLLAPDNKIYSVKVGDVVGDRANKIIHIFPDRMELMEHKTENGGVSEKVITLQLNK